MITILQAKNYTECLSAAASAVGESARSSKTPVVVFSEDRLTLSLERAICAKCGGGTFHVSVSTFSRYLAQSTGRQLPVLSKEGAAMAVRKMLAEVQADCFAASGHYAGFAPALYELIAQMKSARVSPDDLERSSANAEGVLKRKLDDILAVYRAYEAFLQGGYYDENSYLALLPEVIERDETLAHADVYVVGYPSFTRQAEQILCALIGRAKSLTAIVVNGKNEELYTGEAAAAVERAAKSAGKAACKKTWQGSLTDSGEHLAANLYVPTVTAGIAEKREAKDVFVYQAENYAAEADFVARGITSAVHGGARYHDVAVLVGNAECLPALKNALTAYGVPFFADERHRLSAHPLSAFVFRAMETARRGCDPKDVVALAKNPLLCEDKTLSDNFENYLLKSAVTRKTVRLPFVFSDKKKGEQDEAESATRIAAYDRLRSSLLAVVDCFPARATAREYAAAVRQAFALVDAPRVLARLSADMLSLGEKSAAAVTDQAAERWEKILRETETILQGAPLKLEEYLAVLRAGAEAAEISTIPLSCDAVFVGGLGATIPSPKILYAVGLTSDVPSVKADTAILSDKDLSVIADYRVLVEPTIRSVNRRVKESAALGLTGFAEKLYLTYPLIGKDGRATRRSELVDYVLKLFTRGGRDLPVWTEATLSARVEQGGEAAAKMEAVKYAALRPALLRFAKEANDYRKGVSGDFTAASSFYAALDEKAAANAVLARTNSEMGEVISAGKLLSRGLSASALENYFACPYRYFMEKGLRLEEREEGQVRPLDSGTILHAVVELFLKEYRPDLTAQTAAEAGRRLFDGICAAPEYARFASSAENRNLFDRLRGEAGRACVAVWRELSHTAFRPLGQEVSFGGKGDAFSSVDLRVGERVIPISGKVDRVDEADGYVRVIDYKTGTVKEKEAQLYSGCKLQLYLYANAFTQDGKYKAAGCYYFPVSDDFTKEEDVAFRMLGRTVENTDVAVKMDTSLTGGGKSQSLNFEVTVKEGEPALKKTEAVVSQRQMDAFLRYAVRVSEGAAAEIADGFIQPVAAAESICEYCNYAGTCRRDERGGVRKLPSTVSAEFLAQCVESEEETK